MSKHGIIIFGVSGCGKSTIGMLLAEKLNLPFFDADDFHPTSNIEKLTKGIPLTDDDREPWLKAINTKITEAKPGFILSCSALKESYRLILSQNIKGIRWIHLDGTFDLIYERLKQRSNHFMNPELLKDQFDTLEIPEYGKKYSIDYPPDVIVQKILNQIVE